jgi:hypothetical protein
MEKSKIQLSTEEMQLVNNSHWILTKHRIIEKVYNLFGAISQEMQSSMQNFHKILPPEILQLSPKISKGEKYETLPYVVLDYPRCFSKEDVFAIRIFFWWGNYFSISLHLKGKFQKQFAGKIMQAIKNKKFNGYYLSSSGDEFNFNLDNKNSFLINNTMADSYEPNQYSFFKITNKISLEHWNTAQERLVETLINFMNAISA